MTIRIDDPVARIMSVPVYSVRSHQHVSDVRRLLREHNFHHMPVVDEGVLVGMVSSSDLVGLGFGDFGASQGFLDAYLDTHYPIHQIMRRDLVTIGSTETILRAAEILASGRFHALPVVDGRRALKGLVTTTDLVRFLVQLAG